MTGPYAPDSNTAILDAIRHSLADAYDQFSEAHVRLVDSGADPGIEALALSVGHALNAVTGLLRGLV